MAVPLPLLAKVAQLGRPVCPLPVDWEMLGVGSPVVETVKLPVDTVKVVELALVIDGA